MPSTEHIHHLFLEVTTSQYFVLCTLGPQTFQHEGQVLWETEGEGGGRRSLRELASSRFLTGRGPVPGSRTPALQRLRSPSHLCLGEGTAQYKPMGDGRSTCHVPGRYSSVQSIGRSLHFRQPTSDRGKFRTVSRLSRVVGSYALPMRLFPSESISRR